MRNTVSLITQLTKRFGLNNSTLVLGFDSEYAFFCSIFLCYTEVEKLTLQGRRVVLSNLIQFMHSLVRSIK